MIYISILFNILFLSAAIFFFLCTRKLLNILEEIKEILEKKLDNIDIYYQKLTNILDLDLFSDDQYVKDFISLLKDLRKDIIDMAEKLFRIGEK
jgi:hypothetical protein